MSSLGWKPTEDGSKRNPRDPAVEELSEYELELMAKITANPRLWEDTAKVWIADYVSQNLMLPVSQLQGFAQYVYTKGAAFPTNPVEGQFFSITAVAGTIWNFRFNSQSVSTYKWEFVGGPPLIHEIETEETTTSASAADLSTNGPTLTMPFAGEYLATMMCHGRATGSGAEVKAHLYANGSDVADASSQVADSQAGAELPRADAVTLAGASQVIKMRYSTTAGTGHFRDRTLFVTPIRVI